MEVVKKLYLIATQNSKRRIVLVFVHVQNLIKWHEETRILAINQAKFLLI